MPTYLSKSFSFRGFGRSSFRSALVCALKAADLWTEEQEEELKINPHNNHTTKSLKTLLILTKIIID